MQIADAEKDKKMALRAFMSKLEQALKAKTGQPQHRTALKIHGLIRPMAAKHPRVLATISIEIDKLPRGKEPEWYRLNALAIIRDAEQAIRAQVASGRHAGAGVIGRRAERYTDEEWAARRKRPAATLKDVLPAIVGAHHHAAGS